VWEVATRQFVNPSTISERAATAQLVLLGEIHDNPEHHRIQLRILEQMLQGGRRPALVMEQYDRDQQGKLDEILQGSLAEQDRLIALSQLMRTSWDWPHYEPIIRLALQHKLTIVAANLSRDELRTVSRNGFGALGAGEDARLALETVWTPERQQQLLKDVFDGHCGKVRDHVVQAIAKSQRARDAVMADTLLKFRETGAIAILGRGHVRRDMGVPLYLSARAPELTVLALGMTELTNASNPLDYAHDALGPQYDYLWFTPRVVRQVDPCDSIPSMPSAPVKSTV
jgi:uncharacterized iron-regulated protein